MFNLNIKSFLKFNLSLFLPLLGYFGSFIVLAFFILKSSRNKIIFLLSIFFIFLTSSMNYLNFDSDFLSTSILLLVVSLFYFFFFLVEIINFYLNKNKLLIFFVFYLLFHSIFVSYYPSISLLKSLLWSLIFLTIFHAAHTISEDNLILIKKFIFIFLLLFCLLSIFFLGSNYGYMRNNTGFQGLTFHPQVFGIIVGFAYVGVYYLDFSKNIIIKNLLKLLIFIILFYLIYQTESRGSLISLILSFFIAVIFTNHYSYKSKLLIFGVIFFMSFTFVFSEYYNYFISKSYRAPVNDIFSAYQISRGHLIDMALDKIDRQFFLGYGFGLPYEMEGFKVKYSFGIPMSAPVEKGVLILALFHELGLIGFILFAITFISIFVRISFGIVEFMIVSLIFFINLYESTFFSASGVGLITLLLFCLFTRKNDKLKLHEYK